MQKSDREEPKKNRKAEKKLREETEFAASQTPAKPKSSAFVSSTFSIDVSRSSSSDKTKKKGTVANVEPPTSEKEGEADPSQDLEVDRDGADQSDSDQTTGQGVGRFSLEENQHEQSGTSKKRGRDESVDSEESDAPLIRSMLEDEFVSSSRLGKPIRKVYPTTISVN